jgi:outer membrane protein, heavy metal efflux system
MQRHQHIARALRAVLILQSAFALFGNVDRVFAEQADTQPSMSPPSHAPLPDDLTLSDLLAKAKTVSAKLKVERAHIAVAAAQKQAASIYPNPSLSYISAMNASGSNLIGGTQHTAMLNQPLLVGGQRGSRQQEAAARLDVARDTYEVATEEMLADARRLFVTLLVKQELVKTLTATQADLSAIRKSIEARAEAGFKSRYDVMRLDSELAAFSAQVDGAKTDCMQVSGELASLLGIPDWHPRAVGEAAPAMVPADFRSLWKDARKGHPVIKAARASEVDTRRALDVAYSERWPDLVVSVGSVVTTSEYSFAPMVGLSWTFPVFDRNQGAVAKAAADQSAAELETHAAEVEIYNDLDTAIRVLNDRSQQLATFEKNVLAQLPELRQLAEFAYRNGQATILDLLDTFRTENERRAFHLSLVESVMQAEVNVLAAWGRVEWQPVQEKEKG